MSASSANGKANAKDFRLPLNAIRAITSAIEVSTNPMQPPASCLFGPPIATTVLRRSASIPSTSR